MSTQTEGVFVTLDGPIELPDQAAPGRTPRRFDRAARLFSDEGFQKLAGASVTIFGLGGVGSWCAEALARSGVGKMTLVDFDVVCATNANRQLHALRSTLGKPKSELMMARLQAINPRIEVRSIRAFYEAGREDELLSPRPDYVIDAIDNITAKCHLLHTCRERGIPVATSMGAAARWDPTQIRIADLSDTRIDSFAKHIRAILRQKYGWDTNQPTGVLAAFSLEHSSPPHVLAYDLDGEFLCVCPGNEDRPHSCDRRSRIDGTAGFVTSAFGMTLASVAVRQLLGRPIPLSR